MPIPIENYVEPAIFDAELEKIFAQQMIVAHEQDVANNDDYFSFRLGKRSFTLRNFNAQKNLLDNVCRHRFNLIDPPGFGNRKFRCGYHGWTYGCDGAASFIPLRDTFKTLPEEIRLPAAPYEEIQGFHFLKHPDARRTAEIAQMLERFESPAGPHFHRAEILHRCNWKLIVENVLEGYHLSFVHATTFTKTGFTSTSRGERIDSELDTIGNVFPDEAGSKQIRRIVPGITPCYRHLFLFPNMFLSIGNDLVIYVATVMPVSVDESVLHYRLYPTEKLLSLTPALRDYFMQDAIDMTAKTLEEDRVLMEMNQIGMLSAQGEYTLCAGESRIEHFHDAYQRFV